MDCGNIKKIVASPFCIGQQLCNIIVIMICFMIWDEAYMSYTYRIYLFLDIIHTAFACRIHPCYSSCAGYSLVNEGGTAHVLLVDCKWWMKVPFAIWLNMHGSIDMHMYSHGIHVMYFQLYSCMIYIYIRSIIIYNTLICIHMLSRLHTHTSAVFFTQIQQCMEPLSPHDSFCLVSGTLVTVATKQIDGMLSWFSPKV